MRVKKAQSGAGAAVLVAIIAALIVLYILFLPPEDREELLKGNGTSGGGSSSIVQGNKTILLETPGRLDYLEQKEIEHPLPSVNLYTNTKAELLKSVPSLNVRNGWFDKATANITFPIEDLENTVNVKLVFNIGEHKGNLLLKLNGNVIYHSEVPGSNIEPIPLPIELLKERNNIEASVSGVGVKFWSTNEYALENIKITADVADISTRESKLVFLVTSTEKNSLDRVFVRFYPDCKPSEVGVLDIFLNNHNIFSSVPDCSILRPLEVSPHYLTSGENTLIFRGEKGVFLIDQIMVKSELKEITYPTYYFELNKTVMREIQDEKLDVTLYLDFVDDISYKKGQIFINGHLTHLDTRDSSFSKNINIYVNEGNNAVEIIPKTGLDIINLKVVLEE